MLQCVFMNGQRSRYLNENHAYLVHIINVNTYYIHAIIGIVLCYSSCSGIQAKHALRIPCAVCTDAHTTDRLLRVVVVFNK